MPHRIKIILFIAGVLILGLGILFIRGVFVTLSVPKEFSDARVRGAQIAQTIVDLANQSQEDLTKIEAADRNKQYSEALDLVNKALDENKKARESAVDLSTELGKMTQAIPNIKPSSAGLVAMKAVSNELTLVTHLISQNEYLFNLLGVLNDKFSGKISKSDGEVKSLITNINVEIQAINILNSKFADFMAEFDQLTK